MNRPTRSLALIAVLAFVACGDATETGPEPALPDIAGLTVEWGCGYGFWLGNDEQTVALRFEALDAADLAVGETYPAASAADETAIWLGSLHLGRDLYANWCDDVIEPNEPEPVLEGRWTVTDGTVEVIALPAPNECGAARAWLRGLAAEAEDGRSIDIGDLLVTNTAWGCFAG